LAFDADVTPTATDRPRPDGGDIRKMTVSDVAPVARVLARAFYDDPHFCWIVRDDATRMRRLERGFETFVRRIWLSPDESYVHVRGIGAALWMPPGTWHMGPLGQLRLLPAIVGNLRADSGRLLKAVTWMEKNHPHERHLYLPAIGVAPAWQGRGFGAALLRPMLERCDRERLPAYLEASTPRNRALYERHGFEVFEEGRYADDGPPIWLMWREPRSQPDRRDPER
jgi:ribosomal protein S18 acetylase RimI-like enzyme